MQDEALDRERRLRDLALSYREPLVRYFRRRGLSNEAAEDCTQEVFVRVSRVDQRTVDSPDAYLFTIAASVVVDHSRAGKSRQEGHHVVLDELLPSGEASPALAFEGRQALERLAAILHELPDRTSEIFLLNRLDALTYTQLAARYGLSVKSIEKHMSKALAHLRNRYEPNDRS